jgi:ABC-type polar amino acid transport system ATPase subunit
MDPSLMLFDEATSALDAELHSCPISFSQKDRHD